nr:alpha/beta hydrolase [Zoogloeaceae bacterium]
MKLRNTILSIPAASAWLDARLSHAPDLAGLIVILKPGAVLDSEAREAYIAGAIQRVGYATLLVDLLTHHEEARDPDARYNVPQLANRVLAVAAWIAHQAPLHGLPIGLIALDTACGAAVRAAWKAPDVFSALVCRGGRPDLAGATPLSALSVPLCMIIGGQDPGRAIVTRAYELITARKAWHEVPDASDLFIEPGTLDSFCQLASAWFKAELPPPALPAAQAADPGPATADPDGSGRD